MRVKVWWRLVWWFHTSCHMDFSARPQGRGNRGLLASADRLLVLRTRKTGEVVSFMQPRGSLLVMTPLVAGVLAESVWYHMAACGLMASFVQHVVLNIDDSAPEPGLTPQESMTATAWKVKRASARAALPGAFDGVRAPLRVGSIALLGARACAAVFAALSRARALARVRPQSARAHCCADALCCCARAARAVPRAAEAGGPRVRARVAF